MKYYLLLLIVLVGLGSFGRPVESIQPCPCKIKIEFYLGGKLVHVDEVNDYRIKAPLGMYCGIHNKTFDKDIVQFTIIKPSK